MHDRKAPHTPRARKPLVLAVVALSLAGGCKKTRSCGPATVTPKWQALGLPLAGQICKATDSSMEVQVHGRSAAEVRTEYEQHLTRKGWEKRQTTNEPTTGAVGLAFTGPTGPTVLNVITLEPAGFDDKPVVVQLDFFGAPP